MKLQINIDPGISEPELTLKCGRIDDSVLRLQEYLNEFERKTERIVFKKENTEYYFPIDRILFFETTSREIAAHTADDLFFVDKKLYELEELLPPYFLRISKSAIINTKCVYSIDKNLTGASRVRFLNSNKLVYVSRNYFSALRERLILNSMKGD